jgi:hypothetical protein
MASQPSNELKELTVTEAMAIICAARLLTALQYRVNNPGGDPDFYSRKIGLELVSISSSTVYLILINAATAIR